MCVLHEDRLDCPGCGRSNFTNERLEFREDSPDGKTFCPETAVEGERFPTYTTKYTHMCTRCRQQRRSR